MSRNTEAIVFRFEQMIKHISNCTVLMLCIMRKNKLGTSQKKVTANINVQCKHLSMLSVFTAQR